jgi:hypothetical protein
MRNTSNESGMFTLMLRILWRWLACLPLAGLLLSGAVFAQAVPDAKQPVPPAQGKIALQLVNGKLSMPLHPRASLTNSQAREFYLEGARQIGVLNEFLKTQPLSAEQRAVQLIETRNALRTEARALMSDRELAQTLDVSDPNKTVAQLVEHARSKGLSGDALWNYLAQSASRTRASVNESLKVKP